MRFLQKINRITKSLTGDQGEVGGDRGGRHPKVTLGPSPDVLPDVLPVRTHQDTHQDGAKVSLVFLHLASAFVIKLFALQVTNGPCQCPGFAYSKK